MASGTPCVEVSGITTGMRWWEVRVSGVACVGLAVSVRG